MKRPDEKYIALTLISLAWLIIFSGRLIGPTLLVQIEAALDISHAQAGVALSASWFFYGIMQYPGGTLSDSFGRKKIIILAITLFATASILIGFTMNYIMLLVTFAFLGLGAGVLAAPSLTMIAELFGPEKGKALGIRSASGSLSGLIPMALPIAAVIIGWRNIFFLWGVMAFVSGYIFYIFVTESLKEPKKDSIINRFKIGLTSFKEKDTVFLFIVNLIISFAWIGMLSWFPTYIQETKGFGAETAGILFSIVLLGGILLKPIIGHLSDSFNKLWIMLGLTISASLALFLLTMTYSFYALVGVSFMVAQTSAFYPVRTSFLMENWYSETAGTKFGVFRSGIILLGSPISAFIGWSASRYGFDLSILLVSAALFLASILIIIKIIAERF